MKKSLLIISSIASLSAITPVLGLSSCSQKLIKDKEYKISVKNACTITANTKSLFKLNLYGRCSSEIFYSVDGGHIWKYFDEGEQIEIAKGKQIMFFGNNPYGLSYDENNYVNISISGSVTLSGNIMSLVGDRDNKLISIPNDYCFYRLFAHMSQQNETIKIENNFLPATDLKSNCYAQMFAGANVVELPAQLPATTLAEACYYGMFTSTSIRKIPENFLPATKVKQQCYESMFSNCLMLEDVPDNLLPALSLSTGNGCYRFMFEGCSSLSKPINLPATKLSEQCYLAMFRSCENMTIPSDYVLPAQNLAPACYMYMFAYTPIVTLPNKLLPAKTCAKDCYHYMFDGCNSLRSIPADLLPATTLADDCYHYMFAYCRRLSELPSGLLSAPYNANENYVLPSNCFFGMFEHNESLQTIPEGFLPYMKLGVGCYQNMFNSCYKLETIPKNLLPAMECVDSCYNTMFGICKALKEPCNLPATLPAGRCYCQMFTMCASLELPDNYELPAVIPEELTSFDDLVNFEQWGFRTFANCNIQRIPDTFKLKSKRITHEAYRDMFMWNPIVSCPDDIIPEVEWIDAYDDMMFVYHGMFAGCKLTKTPNLPNKKIGTGWYQSMFLQNTELTTAKMDVEEFVDETALDKMFQNCTKLSSVEVNFTEWPSLHTEQWLFDTPETGTFICPSELKTWIEAQPAAWRDQNTVPPNWTITAK